MGRWADIVGLLHPLKIISGDNALYLGTGNRPSTYGFPNSVYLVMDKTSSADDATVVYRTNGNARAESGLAEDDDYHIKTISGTYGSEVFTDRVIVRGSGFVDAVNSILRVNSATGTPTAIVGNSDGVSAGAGVEISYDQVNRQGTLNCIERGNTYRGFIINCDGITYNFGGTTVANAGSFNQFGFTTNVPISVNTSGSIGSIAITDTGTSGANLKLAGNGATTPNKTIRAQGGNLEFVNDAYTTVVASMDDAGTLKLSGRLLASGSETLASGVGAELFYDGTNGYCQAFDHTALVFKPLVLRGSTTTLTAGLTSVAQANSTAFQPLADNTYTCGVAADRWKTIYAGTGTINTSDARDKTPVAPLSAAEVAAAKALAAEIGTYQFLDAITEKGDDKARHHVGLTVQRAIEIMQSHGLEPTRYGFICHDVWEATPEQVEIWPDQYTTVEVEPAVTEERLVRAAGSEVTQPARAAGDRYSFRPDELLLFLARGFDARLAALESAQ